MKGFCFYKVKFKNLKVEVVSKVTIAFAHDFHVKAW